MNRRILVTLVALSGMIFFGCVSAHKGTVVGNRVVFEKERIAFNRINGWTEVSPSSYLNIYRTEIPDARIRVRSTVEKKANSLKEHTTNWITLMTNKFEWKDVKVINEGYTAIDNERSYWTLIKFRVKDQIVTQKTYSLYNGPFWINLRLTCISNCKANEAIFDEWVKSVDLL